MTGAALALVLAAAAPQTAADAERAFAAMAQTQGQWTAFRAFAARDGIMFNPQPVNAHELLKDAPNPPVSVMWWPAESWVSCDGRTAVNTGPWVRAGGTSTGYFTTVWQKQADGSWKWLLDHGDALPRPRPAPERVTLRKASCKGAPPPRPEAAAAGGGNSPDASLTWEWTVQPDGSRRVAAYLWDGRAMEMVLQDEVAAPAQ